MEWLDWVLFGGYVGLILIVGLLVSRNQKNASDFFFASRNRSTFVAALSICASAFSAINYVAFSSEIVNNGCYVMLSLPIFIVVAIPVTKIVIPFFHGLEIISAYEYLENRFNLAIRVAGSLSFVLWRVSWAAVAIYVPSKVLTLISGMSYSSCILLAGLIVLVYASLGGQKAVMLTDGLQFFVILSSIIAMLGIATFNSDGFFSMMRLGIDGGLARPFYPFEIDMLSINPTTRISLWSALIGTFVAFCARYSDQTMIMRFKSTKSAESSSKAFKWSYIAALSVMCSLSLLGFAVYAHAVHDGTLDKPYTGTKRLVDMVLAMPMGIPGLITAGLTAATMSTVDSASNACASALSQDIYVRLLHPEKKEAPLYISKLITLLVSLAATLLAWLVIPKLGDLFTIANKIVNAFGSPILAVFCVGLFDRFLDNTSVLCGLLIGVCCSVFSVVFFSDLAIHYFSVVNLIATLGTMYSCALVLRLLGKCGLRKRRTPNWKLWTWRGRMSNVELEQPLSTSIQNTNPII